MISLHLRMDRGVLKPSVVAVSDVIGSDGDVDVPARRRSSLIVRPVAGEKLEVVAGWDVIQRAKRGGLTHVSALVRISEPADLAERLIEHLCLNTLDPIEEANLLRELMNVRGLSQREVERCFGVRQPQISKRLKLLRLRRQDQARVATGELSIERALKLAS